MEAIAAEVTNHLSTKLELGDLQQPRVGDLQTVDLAYMIHNKIRQGKDANVEEAVNEINKKTQELLQQNVWFISSLGEPFHFYLMRFFSLIL